MDCVRLLLKHGAKLPVVLFVEGLRHNIKNEVRSIVNSYADPVVDKGYVGREVLKKLYNIPKNML
jgi:hypothetical protein